MKEPDFTYLDTISDIDMSQESEAFNNVVDKKLKKEEK